MLFIEDILRLIDGPIFFFTLGTVALIEIYRKRGFMAVIVIGPLGVLVACYFYRDRINEYFKQPANSTPYDWSWLSNDLSSMVKSIAALFPDVPTQTPTPTPTPAPQPSHTRREQPPPSPKPRVVGSLLEGSSQISDSRSPEAVAQMQLDIRYNIRWNQSTRSRCVPYTKMHIKMEAGYPMGNFRLVNFFPTDTLDIGAAGYTNNRRLSHGEIVTVLGEQPDYVQPYGWSCLVQVDQTSQVGLVYKTELIPQE